MSSNYTHLLVNCRDQIGQIKLNRPNSLNAWNEALLVDLVTAFRELDEHPGTVFTVLTGEGRFFSAGADIREEIESPPPQATAAQRKLFYMRKFSLEMELFRSMIDHKKVFVLALNGPAVGGGAAWFQGIADIFIAASGAYMKAPFNSLSLVPEYGAAHAFSQSIGVHRSSGFFIFGQQYTVEQMEAWGLINKTPPADDFHSHLWRFLQEQLEINDAKSMLETKRLQAAPLRANRILAMFEATHAMAERFVDGAPMDRFRKKARELSKGSETRYGKPKALL